MNKEYIILINSQFHFVMNSNSCFGSFLPLLSVQVAYFLESTCTVFSVKFVFNLTLQHLGPIVGASQKIWRAHGERQRYPAYLNFYMIYFLFDMDFLPAVKEK